MVDNPTMFTMIFAFTMPSTSLVMEWLVFGAIGTIAVGYAKMKEEWACAVLGFSLMFYPYVFPSGIGFGVVGTILSILFFMPKRILGFWRSNFENMERGFVDRFFLGEEGPGAPIERVSLRAVCRQSGVEAPPLHPIFKGVFNDGGPDGDQVWKKYPQRSVAGLSPMWDKLVSFRWSRRMVVFVYLGRQIGVHLLRSVAGASC